MSHSFPLVPLTRASWSDALPPGRLGCALAGDELLWYSISELDAYQTLASTGVLRCDPTRSDPDYAEAYDWMRARHAARIPGSTGAPLLWGWVQTTRRELQSALYRAVRYSDTPQLLLAARIPRARVLCSEFNEYHSVLNRWEVCPEGLSDDDLEARVDAFFDERKAAGADTLPLAEWPADLRDRMLASWEQIFDPSRFPRRSHWQGCVEEVRSAEVISAVELLPR